MTLGWPSTRRFWVYVLLLASGLVVVFVWFIPQISKANQKAPVHMEVGFSRPCADSALEPPNYGSHEAVRYCSN